MNSEVEVSKNELVNHRMSTEKEEIFENKNIEAAVAKEAPKNNTSIDAENRFARLKRNLRKRSVSIL